MRTMFWTALAGGALVAAVGGWWISQGGETAPEIPDEVGGPASEGPANMHESADARPPEDTLDPAQAEAARRAAGQLAAVIAAEAQGNAASPEVVVHDAGIAAQEVSRLLHAPIAEDAGVRELGTRCDPPPCVVGFALPTGSEEAKAFQEAFMGELFAIGGDQAQPTISWSPGGEGEELGFVWFVPNTIGDAESNAMQDNAQAHVQALGGRPG